MHFTIADLISDITQNGCESGAKLVELEITEGGGEFRFVVRDNGKGMTKEQLSRAIDPFVTDGIKHPHRKVGLGLPFLIQTAEQSGGGWDIQSEKGEGTTITAWFDTGNVDMPPIGDVPGMFRTILMFEGEGEVIIRRSKKLDGEDELDYEIVKTELVEALGGIEDSGSLILLGEYLQSIENSE
ncbi:MAG: sensor histidine kinase [Treponema sp.]|nr:sensor histidine kinase [Treponema sp.]